MMRRTPLRRSRMSRKPKPNSYNTRERAFEFMGWVKQQPCMVQVFIDLGTFGFGSHVIAASRCEGVVEADHAGSRGIGRKASDYTTIPLCTKHHFERTNFAGAFAFFKQEHMRAFLASAIQYTQNRARMLGLFVPAPEARRA